jgi:PIN domain nuclease of toxin-antitoxin system
MSRRFIALRAAAVRWTLLFEASGIVVVQPILPMNHQHALRAGAYANEHRDPFDRMLVAQSEIENATVVSLDPAMTLLGALSFRRSAAAARQPFHTAVRRPLSKAPIGV